uniref:Uncharacterized protein n=1 Tax=Arundo donax TaxID=35708 RepID=A0A0A9C0G8_ARUDO
MGQHQVTRGHLDKSNHPNKSVLVLGGTAPQVLPTSRSRAQAH